MKKNKIIIVAPSVCLTGRFLSEGRKYTYKTGVRKTPVVLEEILEYKEELVLKLQLLEENRTIEVKHQYTDTPYLDSLRFFDYDPYDYGLPYEGYIPSSESLPRDKPEVPYDRETFFNYLTVEQLSDIINHFSHHFGSTRPYKKQINLAYLAWLLGEKHLLANRGLLIYNPDEVNIDMQEYNGLPDGLKTGIPDIEELRQFYLLDLLYKNVFENKQRK